MKPLYIYTDNSLVIVYNILPFLNFYPCVLHKDNSDIHSLSCISKYFSNLVEKNCEFIKHPKCEIKDTHPKRCNTHCKAQPIYKFLKIKFRENIILLTRLSFTDNSDFGLYENAAEVCSGADAVRPIDQWLHFDNTILANLMYTHYAKYFENGRCCDGKGLKWQGACVNYVTKTANQDIV